MLGVQSTVHSQDIQINQNNFSMGQDLLLAEFQLLVPAKELFIKVKEGVI